MPLNLGVVIVTTIPILISTVISHFLPCTQITNLARSQANRELAFALCWSVVKSFLELATEYKMEELQHFTNKISPALISSSSIHNSTIILDGNSSDNSADILVKVLGGKEKCYEIIGGTKWWQLRTNSIHGEWIWSSSQTTTTTDWNDRKVILYITGGGYYFGSIQTHRDLMNKHAKRTGARIFAIDYAKAPQFPFPCGLQDILAAYLYLIDPPLTAKHTAVSPSSIIIEGDSAGAGLVLSLLQVIRNARLPRPRAAIVISPWCDLTHSFPSVGENSDYDIIPPHSFIHQPSPAWPPPHEPPLPPYPLPTEFKSATVDTTVSSATLPFSLTTSTSTSPPHSIIIDTQIQIYAPNHPLSHPLVSPALGEMRGLVQDLLVLVSNKESLRDEGIWIAHRAAGQGGQVRKEIQEKWPEMFHGRDEWREVETKVHLQCYDEACHILPVFSITRIAQACYASIATFSAHVFNTPSISSGIKGEETTTSLRMISSGIEKRIAGDPETYYKTPYVNNMIRERVGIRGAISRLEDKDELSAFKMGDDSLGVIKIDIIERFLNGRHLWAKKFSKVAQRVERKQDRLAMKWCRDYPEEVNLCAGEKVPKTALAGRRDTLEAQALARLMFDSNRHPQSKSFSSASSRSTPVSSLTVSPTFTTPSSSISTARILGGLMG